MSTPASGKISDQKQPGAPSASAPTLAWKRDLLRVLLSKGARITAAVLIVLVGGRFAVNWYEHRGRAEAIPTVKVVPVSVQPLTRTLQLPGNVEAVEQANLFSHVSGYLKKLYVDEGDRVKKGQLLATIDAPDAVQEYEKAKAEFQLKKVTRVRYTELLKEKVISQQEFDTVEADANESKARLDNALANLDYTKIRAPFDGSIARRFKYSGDLISAAVRGGGETPIFVLINERNLRVAANVPQIDVSSIVIGHPAVIHVDTLPERPFPGVVSRIDALLDEASKTQRILIDLKNADGQLHAGMFATVDLQIEHKDKTMMIPRQAVTRKGNQSYVYTMVNNHVKEVPVKTGTSDANSVEILEGLRPEDRVALPGGFSLSDGMEILPIAEEKGGSANGAGENSVPVPAVPQGSPSPSR